MHLKHKGSTKTTLCQNMMNQGTRTFMFQAHKIESIYSPSTIKKLKFGSHTLIFAIFRHNVVPMDPSCFTCIELSLYIPVDL